MTLQWKISIENLSISINSSHYYHTGFERFHDRYDKMRCENPVLNQILNSYKPIWSLKHAISLMGWDFETYMPREGTEDINREFVNIYLFKSLLSYRIRAIPWLYLLIIITFRNFAKAFYYISCLFFFQFFLFSFNASKFSYIWGLVSRIPSTIGFALFQKGLGLKISKEKTRNVVESFCKVSKSYYYKQV